MSVYDESELIRALRRIIEARDYCAEHGYYNDGPCGDQEFDDWAADVAAEAISKSNCTNCSAGKCQECGKNPIDYPKSGLCSGCYAYREHTGQF